MNQKGKKMNLSIIIPIYNVEEYISDLLQSIESIDDKYVNHFEVLFVNDGTIDDSVNIIKSRWQNNNIEFNIINQKNAGLSAARNNGLKKAKGEYVWFVDSDDVINGDLLSKSFEKNIFSNQVNLIQINVQKFIGEAPEEKTNLNYMKVKKTKPLDDLLTLRRSSFSVGFFIQREFLNKISFEFPVGYLFEDIATSYKLFSQIETAAKVEGAMYFYRQQFQSITHTISKKSLTDRIHHIKNMLNFFSQTNNQIAMKSLYVQHLIAYVSYDSADVNQLEKNAIKKSIQQLKKKWKIRFIIKYYIIYSAGHSIFIRKMWRILQLWKAKRRF